MLLLLMIRYYFGSAKNFYCCRFCSNSGFIVSLEVLRISTVVDPLPVLSLQSLEVLRISTVVDKVLCKCFAFLWKC